MQSLCKWALMLNKRLYKKATFVAIMLVIPVCVLALGFAAKQESGFVKIVLAQEDGADEISSKIVNELLEDNTLIHFVTASSPSQAVASVKNGQADAAWIFPCGMQEKINAYSGIDSNKEPFVKVIEREQTVFLQLSREKLTAAMFDYCAKACYIDFARTNITSLDNLSDEQLLDYYNNVAVSEELFTFSNVDDTFDTKGSTGYLTAPIRGILAVLMVLCGMSAAMFYMQDEKNGTFSLVKENRRIFVSSGCILIAIVNIAVVVLLALFASSVATALLNELLCMALYCVCCTAFCLLLKELFSSVKLYSATVPLFVILMVALCPVFFDLRIITVWGHFFPPTYYINAVYSIEYKLYMVGYTATVTVLALAVNCIKKYVGLYVKKGNKP